MTGESAGLTLLIDGALGRAGKEPDAALMAASTSWAAASILRDRSNCKTTWVELSWLCEVICVTPGISDS